MDFSESDKNKVDPLVDLQILLKADVIEKKMGTNPKRKIIIVSEKSTPEKEMLKEQVKKKKKIINKKKLSLEKKF